jgi:hypothetical protein
MGYVKDRIRELVKENGSKKNARAASEKWFKENKSSKRFNEAKSTRERFEPGKIYAFNYSPISDLDWFDRKPVVLAIERVGDNDLGVNLNLIPVRLKEDMLDQIYNRFQGQINSTTKGARATNATAQRPLRLTYAGMKAYLKSYGYDFAIRQYKPERKTSQAVVSYLRWPEIALCDFISLNGASVQQIRRMFNRR